VIGDHQSPPPCPSVEIILDGPRGRAILGDNGRGGRPSAVIPDATATGRSFGIDEGGARRRVRKMTGSKEVCGQPAERRERERERRKRVRERADAPFIFRRYRGWLPCFFTKLIECSPPLPQRCANYRWNCRPPFVRGCGRSPRTILSRRRFGKTVTGR